jgi:hypothetical protein
MKKLLLVTVFAAIPSAAFAQQGTAQDARAMLEKTAAAIKADREFTLGQINRGEGGFRVGDTYPFCNRLPDGKSLAGPIAVPIGADTWDAKDPTGKAFGKELNDGMMKPEGVVTEVHYLFPKPGTTAPAVPKTTIVMRVAPDLGCGVGYYTAGASAGETLKVHATIKASQWEAQPVADTEGHGLVFTRFAGEGTISGGGKVTVDFHSLADVHNGAGPLNPLYYGITTSDGSQLWLKAVLTARPDGPNHSDFEGPLTVIGGKSKFAGANGDGTFTAERITAGGVGAQATNDLVINLR